MVAMDIRRGSACTIGNKVLQMLLDFSRPRGTNDRVLNGPTTSQWIVPWYCHLTARGVIFHPGHAVIGLDVNAESRRITRARMALLPPPDVGKPQTVSIDADHFIAALPLERMRGLVTDELAQLDGSLDRLRRARDMTAWMVGAQFFLRKPVFIGDGHVAYPGSPWALSSISQQQFWDEDKPVGQRFTDLYGDGSIGDILSVDISDWDTIAPRLGKSAARCSSAQEVLHETWKQLKEGLNLGGHTLLNDDNLAHQHLCDQVTWQNGVAMNAAPLLVHPPGSYRNRPGAMLGGVTNLFLAADYVQTETDLASMEGANEAARLAVNALLASEGKPKSVPVFSMVEDAGSWFRKAKAYDRQCWVERREQAPWPRRLIFRDEEQGPSVEEVEQRIREVEEMVQGLPDVS
jgi:15-cis-phytoene desaturase